MNQADSRNVSDGIQATDTSNRETVGAKAPLPLSHLTMTDRFRLYDAVVEGRILPEAVVTWALGIGAIPTPRVPSFDE
jgi:hypothetical protein